MKKISIVVPLLCLLSFETRSQAQEKPDSLIMEQLQEVVVRAVRGHEEAPFAVSRIERAELADFSKTGKELPSLFSRTPGVVSWSDNGLGTGTSYLRIRGSADSRINVTLDGVSLNSPEDQCVFWANMNSYSSLLGSATIQRGVGSSTNGDGAFGGTVALSTRVPANVASGELSFSYGSYGTGNWGGSFSTGLIRNHLVLDGAFHQTTTDGYVHGTAGRSGSFCAGLSWYSANLSIRYRNIGNYEHTGQAWNGVTAGDNDMSLMDGTYGINTGIKTYADMCRVGLGRYNSLYESLSYDSSGSFARDFDGNYLTARYRMSDGSYWSATTDNFRQDHNLLSATWLVNDRLTTSATLHYTYGYGYYEEFRPNNKLSKFGINFDHYIYAPGWTLPKRSDFVRQKGLEQHTYGLVWNINWRKDSWDVIGGASWQRFGGNHFGYLTYVADPILSGYLLSDGKYKYYDSDACKYDGNVFVKALYHFSSSLDGFVDLQYRRVRYTTDGINDKFYLEGSRYYNQPLDIAEHYGFFNPKAGLSWHDGPHRVFGSVAQSHREPERNNFTDNGSYPPPVAESLTDFEAGYGFSGDRFRSGLNLYYMKYYNQFVQTGLLSDIGEKLTTNIKDSYRAGVEASLACDLASWLSLEANAALSSNRIKDFDEVVEDWDLGSRTIHYDSSTLAFSPSAILNGFADFRWKAFKAQWHTSFVSRQYLDNTQNLDRSLPAYSLSDLSLNYTLGNISRGLRSIDFGLYFGNVFNAHAAQGGWVYSAIYESGGHGNDNRYYQIGFVPAAGFTALGSVTIKF